MRAYMSKKTLTIAIFFFLLLLLAGNASSQVEPNYAGWTVGSSWDDGSGTSYGTILRSTDSGKTWTRQGAGQIADVELTGVFAVDPYTAWVVGNTYPPDDPDGYAAIYHTTDGGSTWVRKGSSNPAAADYVPDVSLLKVHTAGNDVWAVGIPGGTILHTSDDGATWTNHAPTGYENTHLQGVYVVDSNTVWVTGGPYEGDWEDHYVILKTTDAGLSWTRQGHAFKKDNPHYILGISATDADTAWAVGELYNLLKTVDGGATWEQGPNPPFGGLGDTNEVYAVNSSTVWVAGDNGINFTTDGGENWYTGAICQTGFFGISAVSAQKAWSSHGQYDGTGYIAYTIDGGDNWTIIEQLKGKHLPHLQAISFATQPINLDDIIISLSKDVEQLVNDGLLNKGQGNALIVKLDHALGRLVNDRLNAAIKALEAFSNQVDAFVRGGLLTPEDGQVLSDQVNDIIELL